MADRAPPNLAQERRYWEQGDSVVVGIDEVGKGAWAGPLTIGAVVLPAAGRVNGIRDSKMLTAKVREELFGRIDNWARCWSVGHASARECDELGMSDAQRLATRRALDELPLSADRVLLDGNWNYVDWAPSASIVKGDQTCLSIAAASVVAKVVRDQLMGDLDLQYPGYGWVRNAGYGTAEHKSALAVLGVTPAHRKSFAPIRKMLSPD